MKSVDELISALLDQEQLAEVAARTARPWRKLSEHVAEIEAHKNDPWIALRLADGVEIVSLRAGAMAVLVGGPGSGKSTLAANFLYDHATHCGPAIMHSAELPGLEFTARVIGSRCDASWAGVIKGEVQLSEMQRVTANARFFVLEREYATLANLRGAISDAQKEFPGQPVLVCVDYVQILEAEAENKRTDERLRVSDIVKSLDKIFRKSGAVGLALSQMSTANAKIARAGEALGNEAGELAAETSAFNRYATVALSIGKKTDQFEDGSRVVELSIGKSRMGQGDRVLPLREWGMTGRWIVEGESKSSEEVRTNRDTEASLKREKATIAIILGAVSNATKPVTRNELIDLLSGRRADKLRMIREALMRGDICEVVSHGARSKKWNLWTREKAMSNNVEIVSGSANLC